MTDKPPAYENQFPAGYGMQSGQSPPLQQQGNFPPMVDQYNPPQYQQQPTVVTQYVSKYNINS